MPAVRFNTFAGEIPIRHPHKLDAANAQVAKDTRLWSGALEPMRALRDIRPTSLSPRTIFRYDEDYWFEWNKLVHAVHSPIENDQYDRAMFTGDGPPKVTSAQLAFGSGAPYPNNAYRLGVPAPDVINGEVKGLSEGSADTRFYLVTFVNGWGEEGPPSPVSAEFEVTADQTVELDVPPVIAGNWDLESVRIYRTNTAGAQAAFQYVGSASVSDDIFTDDVPSAHLGERIPSQDWEMPPDDLEGLVSLPSGVLAGFRGNQLLLSEIGLPHAWPTGNRFSFDYDIVGLCPIENGLAVLTEGQPYVALGMNPAAMQPQRLRVPYACTSAEGIAQVNGGAMFPTADGLALIEAGGRSSLFTERLIDPTSWKEDFNPETMRAYTWRNMYLAFYRDRAGADKAFLIDPRDPQSGLVEMTGRPVRAGYNAPDNARLYLAVNDRLQEWDAGDDLEYIWRSKPITAATAMRNRVVQVHAVSYPVTVSVFRDGGLQARIEVGDDAPRRIPNVGYGRDFEIEVSSRGRVYEVVLASSIQALRE